MAGQGLMNHRYLIKKNFKQKLKHSNLNAEKMTNAYYKHSKKEIKSLVIIMICTVKATRYYYLKISAKSGLKYVSFTQLTFYQRQD